MEVMAVTLAGAQASPDRTQRTISVSGAAEITAAAECLFQQLEQPANSTIAAATLRYGKPFGEQQEEIAIFTLPLPPPRMRSTR
jgi:hypothetical protein